MNVLDPFLKHVKGRPETPALISESGTMSYRALEQASLERAASFTAQGIQQGDHVLVLETLSADLYVTLLALFRTGAVAVFPDASQGLAGVANASEQVPIKAFIAPLWLRLIKLFLRPLRRLPSLSKRPQKATEGPLFSKVPNDHPALITFTSGSTGRPKGIVRSHGFLLEQHRMLIETLDPQQGDVDLISLPIFILSNLGSGITSVLPAGDIRSPEKVLAEPIIQQIKTHAVNRLILPPAFCRRLCQTGHTLEKLNKVFTGGGPVYPNDLRSIKEMAPNADVITIFGSTEAEPIAHSALSETSDEDFQAMENGAGLLAGHIAPGTELRLVDDEIVVSGDHVVKGYLNPEDNVTTKILENGKVWHKTGDAGRLDEDGRLWLLGRLTARSQDQFPFCIEAAALSIPGVEKAAYMATQGSEYLLVELSSEAATPLKRLQDKFPNLNIKPLKLPMDKRHNSKIDYDRLKEMLENA